MSSVSEGQEVAPREGGPGAQAGTMGGKSSKNDFSNQVLLNEQRASAPAARNLPPSARLNSEHALLSALHVPGARVRARACACTHRDTTYTHKDTPLGVGTFGP